MHEEFIKKFIQPIYNEVLDYTSTIQKKFHLLHEENERITRLKKVHRDAIEILTHVKKLISEISHHEGDYNNVLNNEYLKLKCSIIELLRFFLHHHDELFFEECKTLLDSVKSEAETQDVNLILNIDD